MKLCHIKIDVNKGRGVYAGEIIHPGEIIEHCQLLFIPLNEAPLALEPYVFEFDTKSLALALGNGSLFNHHNSPNAYCYFEKRKKILTFEAIRRIHTGEEIVINYGYTAAEKKRFGII